MKEIENSHGSIDAVLEGLLAFDRVRSVSPPNTKVFEEVKKLAEIARVFVESLRENNDPVVPYILHALYFFFIVSDFSEYEEYLADDATLQTAVVRFLQGAHGKCDVCKLRTEEMINFLEHFSCELTEHR